MNKVPFNQIGQYTSTASTDPQSTMH